MKSLFRDFLLGIAIGAGLWAVPACPQTPQDDAPPAPAPHSQQPPKKNEDNPVRSAPDQPMWDPLRADKDMQVGKYYMKKGDVDAAIDRFEDATLAKPGFALPFLYLGEAYEKKGKKKPAVKAYQRYLDLDPKADDGDKIRKKIEKLHQEIDKEKKDISESGFGSLQASGRVKRRDGSASSVGCTRKTELRRRCAA